MIDKIRYLNVEVRTLVGFLNPFVVTLNLELQENVTLHLVQNHNIIGIVLVFSGADFHLLEIAKIIVLRTESKITASKKLMSFALPARSFWVIGSHPLRLGV